MDVTSITSGSNISITKFVKKQGQPTQGIEPSQYVSYNIQKGATTGYKM